MLSVEVSECMRSGRRSALWWLLCGLLCLLWGGLAHANHPPSSLSSAVVIGAEAQSALKAQVRWWSDPRNELSINEIAANDPRVKFAPVSHETMFGLSPGQSLWARLEITRKPDVADHWALRIPVPLLDYVSLYTLHPDGRIWVERRAGDRVAGNLWSETGRYPKFHLDLHEGATTVYIRIQGSTPISVPLHLNTADAAQADDQKGYLGLGMILGALLLLSIICVITAITYRDSQYALYAVFVLVMSLAVSSYTGLAMQLVWPFAPEWADASQGAMAMLSAGGAMWFVEAVLSLKQVMPRWSVALRAWGVLSILCTVIYVFVERKWGVMILGGYVLVAAFLGLYSAQLIWRRGAIVGLWVVLAYTPLAIAVFAAIARAQGWIPMSWIVQYGVVVALLIEVPMMLLALHTHSRDRHAAQTRERAMATQDALTGLLTTHIFNDRLRQTVSRYRRSREHAAVVLIRLVNYHRIQRVHGDQVAEQSILRAVIKMRRVLGDADTAARVGPDEFAVILEGTRSREPVMEMCSRLIALGLMPLKGLQPEVTLQFHASAALLREYITEPEGLMRELRQQMKEMSSRTRRPIRFLDGQSASAVNASAPVMDEPESPDLDEDSNKDDPDSGITTGLHGSDDHASGDHHTGSDPVPMQPSLKPS